MAVPTAPAQPFPWMWIAVGGAAGVVLLAVPVVLLVRRRAKQRTAAPADGNLPLQPVASTGGTSEPTRDERSDLPQAQPAPKPTANSQGHAA